MLYGFSSTGMSLQFHYCCGKLKTVEVSLSQTTSEHKCGMEHKMGSKKCCQTKLLISSQDDFYAFSEIKFNSFPSIYLPPVIYNYTYTVTDYFVPAVAVVDDPPNNRSSLFILHRVFRI